MGTTPAEEQTPLGVIQRIGATATVITEEVARTAYGARDAKSGRLYPLALVLVAVMAAGFSTPSATDWVMYVALVLLAVWIGGHR